jgi:hypothetical protein
MRPFLAPKVNKLSSTLPLPAENALRHDIEVET